MFKNEKAPKTGGPKGFENESNSDGNLNRIRLYNGTTLIKNQRLCVCGAIIPRDEVLLQKARECADCIRKQSELKSEILAAVAAPPRIVKCQPCKRCKKPLALSKLSSLLICKECLAAARTETPAKQRRIIAGIVAKFEASLRRQISVGGVANV